MARSSESLTRFYNLDTPMKRNDCIRVRVGRAICETLEIRRLFISVSATPVFDEEFQQPVGSLPNTSTWAYDTGTDPNAEVNYVDDSSVMSVVSDPTAVGGKALAINILRGANDAQGNPTFTSARINTSVSSTGGNLEYGRIEASIKMPGGPNGVGNGLWPAFWMLGSNFPSVGWPNCGEIDIMENKGTTPGTIQGSLHSGVYSGPRMDPTSYDNLPAGQSFYSSYHLFAVDWSPGSIQFSVDGQIYSTFLESSYGSSVWNFNGHGFYVILNIADGGGFGGALGPNSTFPQTMYVNYIRAYSLTGIGTPTNLTAQPITPTQVNLNWADPSNDADGYVLQRSTSSNFSSINATFNLAQGQTTYQDTTASAGTTYYYRLQAVASDGTNSYQSGYSNTASTTTWVDQDINTTGGSGSFSAGVFTLNGKGNTLSGTTDQFNLLSDPISGNATVYGQLSSLTNTNSSAEAGLMIRNTTASNSIFADIVDTPGGTVQFQSRTTTTSASTSATVTGISMPVWLKLVDSGNSFSGFYSTDDLTWHQVGSTVTLAMGNTVLAGLMVSSNSTSLATANFADVSIGPVLATAAVSLDNGSTTAEGSFAADADFTGGSSSHTSTAIDTTGILDPAPQAVYQYNRFGNNFTYVVPGLTAGASYDVEMQFAEEYWTAAGKRVFNVAINGTAVLNGFDIFATAGAEFKAVEEDFPAVADSSGDITLAFTSVADNAQINGLKIIPISSFAQQAGSTLNVSYDSAGDPVTLGTSGSNITAAEAGNQLSFSGITSIIVHFASGQADTLNFNGPITPAISLVGNSNNDTLNVNSGTFTFPAPTTGSGIVPSTFGTLAIATGAKVVVAAPPTPSDRTVLITNTLSFAGSSNAWQGQLDLNGNDMIVHGGNIAMITNQFKTGYALGAFNGQGIISTSAKNDSSKLTTLGVALNNASGNPAYTKFDGQNVSQSDVLVKYTYFGDADVNGSDNGNDYSLIDTGFGSHGAKTGWQNGDFNYDGSVDGSDYSLIDNAFNSQNVVFASEPAAVVANVAMSNKTTVTVVAPMTSTSTNAAIDSDPRKKSVWQSLQTIDA
jgi:beta-glucanase (GH16 family)/regulation of enolase protein 1 (concanavalin A-like superfamily)